MILPQERLDEVFTVKIRLVRKVNIDCRNGLYAMHTVLKHYSSLRYSLIPFAVISIIHLFIASKERSIHLFISRGVALITVI